MPLRAHHLHWYPTVKFNSDSFMARKMIKCQRLKIHWHYITGRRRSLSTQNRISDGGSLLFMRCVSLTLTGLISAWRRREASSGILAKSLSDCVTVLCLAQCKSRHLKVCGIMKRPCYFQTNGISFILNWNVRCLWCRWRRFHVLLFWNSSSNFPHLIGEPPLPRKLNKNIPWLKKWYVSYLCNLCIRANFSCFVNNKRT